jgi:uncharacterized RDD family membrane protein YckC
MFCRNCGASLAPAPPAKVVCTSCGTAVLLPARFCNACGQSLGRDASPVAAPGGPAAASGDGLPAAEVVDNLEITKPRKVEEPAQPEPDPGPGPREVPADPPPPEEPPIEARGVPAATRSPAVAEPMPEPIPEKPIAEKPPAPEARKAPEVGPRPVPLRPASAPATRAPAEAPPAPLRPASRPVRVEAAERVPTPPLPMGAVPAGFGSRLAAGLLDGLIVTVGQLVLMAPVLYYWQTHELPATPADVPYWPILLSLLLVPVVIALGCVYYVYYWGVKGATPGKKALGLVVESEDGTRPIGLTRATVRVLCYLLSGVILGIGFLMIAFGGQGLHDRLARTRVMRERA